jgi:hypothetical protein
LVLDGGDAKKALTRLFSLVVEDDKVRMMPGGLGCECVCIESIGMALDGIGVMGAEAAKAIEHDKVPQTTGMVPSGG